MTAVSVPGGKHGEPSSSESELTDDDTAQVMSSLRMARRASFSPKELAAATAAAVVETEVAQVASTVAVTATRKVWKEKYDAESGRVYWKNLATKQKVFTRPPSEQILTPRQMKGARGYEVDPLSAEAGATADPATSTSSLSPPLSIAARRSSWAGARKAVTLNLKLQGGDGIELGDVVMQARGSEDSQSPTRRESLSTRMKRRISTAASFVAPPSMKPKGESIFSRNFEIYAQQMRDTPVNQATREVMFALAAKKRMFRRVDIVDDVNAVLAIVSVVAAGVLCQLTYDGMINDGFATTGIIPPGFEDS